MTRKDYELIADAVSRANDVAGDDAQRRAILTTAVSLADSLENTNPRFDRERFLSACGVV